MSLFSLPDWATDTENNGLNNTPNKVEPSGTKKAKGFGFPEKPDRGEFNWWMNIVGQWVRQFMSPIYTVQTTGYTAEAGDKVIPNNSSGACTINLPSTPAEGDTAYFRQGRGDLFSVNNLTVGRGGSTIMALAEDMTVSSVVSDNIEFEVYYNGSTWIVHKIKDTGI